MIKKIITFSVGVILLSTQAYAQKEVLLIIKSSYFQPSEQDFKDIYGGGMMYGGEVDISAWERIDIWAGGDYFSKKGKLTLSEENTEIQIIPLYGGVRYRFIRGKIIPYLGLGIGYFFYKESSPIGTVEKGDIGFIGKWGCHIKIEEGLFLDIYGAYSICKAMPADVKADLGGLLVGIGFGSEF